MSVSGAGTSVGNSQGLGFAQGFRAQGTPGGGNRFTSLDTSLSCFYIFLCFLCFQVRITYILSTDMSKHMQDLADFRLKLGCKDFDPVGNVADHQLATMWLFRAADIAHSAKPWNIHRKWSMRVVQVRLPVFCSAF